jgi:hypothetical protein
MAGTTLLKTILWLLIIATALIVTMISHLRTNVRQQLTRGPTCDSYYFNRHDLRQCPPKHEFSFDHQACLPVDEQGCTAAAVTTTITAAEMSCANHRAYRRDSQRPCQCVISCLNSNTKIYSDEGKCFAVDDVTFKQVECMLVPGCRHLDEIHYKKYIDDDEYVTDGTMLNCFNDSKKFVRDTQQPCFRAWTCSDDNEPIIVTCPYRWQCVDAELATSLDALCVPCLWNNRCWYHDKHTPLYNMTTDSSTALTMVPMDVKYL